MKLIIAIFVSFSIIGANSMFCNYFPLDPIACVKKTENVKCYFNQFENACIETESTSHGCLKTLNEMACLNQLTDTYGKETRCHFSSKCIVASHYHLKNLGCSQKFSKYACTNVMNKDCFWDGNQCIEYHEDIPSAQKCADVFNTSVTPSLCSKIKDLKCMNGGIQNQYFCVDVTDSILSNIHCSDPGLNESSCVSVATLSESCIFYSGKCQNSLLVTDITKCSLSFNRLGCLSITNKTLSCQWKQGRCQDFTFQDNQECIDIKEVNEVVCANQKQQCQYDAQKFVCKKPANIGKITCNSRGLTKELCLTLKSQYCTYFNGYCEEIQKEELNIYQCEMQINQDACVNISTKYQFCKWDGSQCIRLIINQDLDCQTQTQVNGNVCQSISKQDSLCKYDQKNHNCIKSNENDFCDSPFLNLFGCININRSGQTCQWTINGCVQIKVKQFETSCIGLGFANPNSCSQVFEDVKTGCYFDEDIQQCKSFKIENSIDLLNNLECTDAKFGLNKIACASITKQGMICRWYQNQCMQIRKKVDVAQVECLKMQYVNQQACALIEFGKEPCRYVQSQLGCVNSLVKSMSCDYPGLNTYACSQASGSCYFDTNLNICKELQEGSQTSSSQITTLLSNMECVSSSPTKDVCKLITTVGQLCSWSTRQTKCIFQSVLFNQSCSAYFGTEVSVNANVCSSIEMDFPDYDVRYGPSNDVDRGYCKFNPTSGNCEKNGDLCATPCCSEKVGINSHSCSRFSKQSPYVYCYFSSDLKCTQLTGDVVDIYNEQAVKNYYNANQMTCSQMNRQSCHMIEWSTKQLCFHNGKSCINLNYANYGNYDIFIQSPAILNKWACLAIEASITNKNTLKYFVYNSYYKRCQVRLASDPSYTTCDQAIGNRNVCLNFTDKLYCKWNTSLLKCVEITNDEYDEIYTCSYNQNKNVCIGNPNTSCQYSYINDRCIDAPTDVDCDYFDTNGPVSKNVCVRITGDRQMCIYNPSRQSCDYNGQGNINGCNFNSEINSITCYKRTIGDCRWDPNVYECYENQDDISTLGCEDYLNYFLCMKVTKESCVWDESKYKCLKQTLTDKSYIQTTNYYNRLACYSVTGGGYIHQISNNYHQCVVTTKVNYQCQEEYLNEYACLFLTKGNNCYYDKTGSPNTYRCKPFTDVQTKCSTDTLINIEVCMQIPQTCLFNLNTLRCVPTTISETQTCTGLQSEISIGYYYNRMSCVSISEYIDSTDGDRKCKYTIGDQVQQCNYEKNCYYSGYTCNVWKPADKFVYDPRYKQEVACGGDQGGTCYEYVAICFEYSPQISLPSCSNNYSKALCLQMVVEQCYFDLGQGGCNSLTGNEHKLPDCTSIVNKCDVSLTPQTACQQSTGSDAKQPGNKCMTVQRSITKCMNNGDTELNLKCADYSAIQDSIICASASDDCRLVGTCTSNKPSAIQNGTYTCDKSMSKTMCESLQCNYAKLGYCQQTEQVPQKTSTNSLYLCYEVNLLKISNKNQICAQVDSSCIYTNKCEDCTGCTCQQVINNVVSSQACISCRGLQTQYDSTKYLCNKIIDLINSCDGNLNYNSCMLNTKDVQCKWLNNQCTAITDLSKESSTDCTIFNQIACLKLTNISCYIDKTTQLCKPLDSTQVGCSDIQELSICQQSFKEYCTWNTTNNTCDLVKLPDIKYTCELANKFGCLNMPNTTCGWSDSNNACYSFQFQSSITSCSNFVDISNQNTNNNLIQFNPITCSQININQICFNDVSNKCRQAVSADVITCTTPGLNLYGCITRATGKCYYSLNTSTNFTECNSTTKQDLGCSNLLNLEACLNQDSYCKFQDNQCQIYDVSKFTDIVATDKFPYSIKVCQVFTVAQSIVYSSEKKRCVKATLRDPFIQKCDQEGINKYACLNKTTGFCQYDDTAKKCQSITKDQLNQVQSCNSTYNWASCIQLNLKCKFINNLCQSVGDDEKCSDLATNKALVNSLVCSTRNNEACKLDNVLNQCVLINTESEICTQIGLNLKGCIHNTKGSFCQYINNQCVNNFNNLQCTDIINEDKCYSIRTSGNYCTFDLKNGCGNIDRTKNNLANCIQTFQTNPLTCSLSTDIPCFYNKQTNKCIQYSQPNQNSNLQLYDWSNSLSFNQLACLQYNENNLAVYWQDQCLQIPTSQFQYLTCSSLVNKLGCLSITNQSEYCQFNTQCKSADLSTFVSQDCSKISNINTVNFCEVNNVPSVKCEYDSTKHACKISDQAITQCENMGYNQYACADLKSCQFNNNRCYQTNDGVKQFCKDATITNCNTVIKEGCDLKCQSIQLEQYQQLNCEQTLNSYGCVRISKKSQYCHFEQGCVNIQPQIFKDQKCVNIKNINNELFCEQPTDIGCVFDIENRSCVAVKSSDQFSCIRGINKLACLNQTNSNLNCQFFDYCYGPNDKILKCKAQANEDPNVCCQNASNIDSCLFQTSFNCQWDSNSCKPFTFSEQDCNTIQNKSKNVCTNQQSSVCTLNSSLFKCESIILTTCDQAQTINQCQQVQNVPCYWNKIEQECEYKEQQSVDQCEDIFVENGNMLACLMIIRQGQLCQFKNNQCLTYQEDKQSDNCLNNINQVACTQQQSSFCYWKQLDIKVKKTQWSDEVDLHVGQCLKFDQFEVSECDENLSYLSCLNILSKGKQCRWIDNICQQIQYSKNDVFSSKNLLLVNSNACGLINSGELVKYNSITNTCKQIYNIDSITCFPFTYGLNKLACLKIKVQQCYWDDKNNQCQLKSRILVEHQLQKIRLLQQSNCRIEGIGPSLCRQINYDLPCASVDDGCDQIDINTATCDTLGLNKYGCLHVVTGPCIWTKDDETNLNSNYHCEEYYPFGACTDVPQNVNSIVCSYVEENACEYNNTTKQCQIPLTDYNTCQIQGINAVGCSKIDGCIFQDQNCVKWNDSYNLLCSEAINANALVCQQAIDRCKFSELTSGCIASTITDNCYTSGLSALGCNVLDQCKWSNNECQCIAYLNQFPQCDTLTEYTKCQNKEYCFFEVSSQNASKDLTQYLKNTNFGRCRDKQCSDLDINKCNNNKINNLLCYLNISQICKSSQKCEDISNPSLNCSSYIINNQSCKWNKNLSGCETLNCNMIISQTECNQFPTYCVYSGFCKTRSCEFMGQTQCLQNNCDWDETKKVCQIQLDCSQIISSDKCVIKKQQGRQCAWLTTTNNQLQCTVTGCRYLGSSQGDCMGTHIGNDVCVQMSDFSCVSCEEITDACICLNQSQYCSYDNLTQQCQSKSCQAHNSEDCPNTHCRFNSNNKICQPLCMYNYNQIQCNQTDECIWDTTNNICISYTPEVVIIPITLPNPDYAPFLASIFLVLIIIQI